MVRESANIFKLLEDVMSTKYEVTYLNDKSFKTWSRRDLAKFKNKISILISLTFGLRMDQKRCPLRHPLMLPVGAKVGFFKGGKGGGSHDATLTVLITFSC